jgi:hypothetical protein
MPVTIITIDSDNQHYDVRKPPLCGRTYHQLGQPVAGYREESRQLKPGMTLAAAFDTNGFRPSKETERDTELAFGLTVARRLCARSYRLRANSFSK